MSIPLTTGCYGRMTQTATPSPTAAFVERQSDTAKPTSTTTSPVPVQAVAVADERRDRPWVSPAPPDEIINYGSGLKLGSRSAIGVSVRSSFGLTLTDNGKQVPEWIRWTLDCDFHGGGPCQVSTMRIAQGPILEEFQVMKHSFSVADGTLRSHIDMERGSIQLSLGEREPRTEVQIRFVARQNDLYLSDFRASLRYPGPSYRTFDYALAPLDQVVNVPILLKGRLTPGAKAWNDAVSSLSPEDQRAWSDLLPTLQPIDLGEAVLRPRLAAAFPGVDIEKAFEHPTPALAERLMRVMTDAHADALAAMLSRSSMSEAGQRRLLEHASARLRSVSEEAFKHYPEMVDEVTAAQQRAQQRLAR